MLSLWITNGEKADCFWRSAMSGGRSTVAHKGGSLVRQAGDICAVSPEGHALTDAFVIECKHYRNLQLPQFILCKGRLAKFWKEAVRIAERHNKKPMLIARQNNFDTLLLIDSHAALKVVGKKPLMNSTRLGVWVYKFDDVMRLKKGEDHGEDEGRTD